MSLTADLSKICGCNSIILTLIGAALPRDDQTQFRAEINYLVPLL